mgnify:CR=1 FL=1|jgi:transcription initiation factor IIE alpha subunit
MKLNEAIEVLKDLKRLSTIPMTLREGIDTILLNKAIDTVVAELEKPLLTDEQMKERGNLTCRVMLRQLNCLYERNNVTMSVKQLEHWFETGQHLKEWKEWDTI